MMAPSASAIAFGTIALFAVVALIDLTGAFSSLEGIGVELPEVLRLIQGREGTIELRLKNPGAKPHPVRLGIPLPLHIVSAQEDVHAMLPANSLYSTIPWPCTALRRGNYPVPACHMEGLSPLKLWALRRRVPSAMEIRVYPNLAGEKKHLAALFMNRGPLGIHSHRQVGKGRDFEKLREYLPGDGYEDIHWKATAKRGHPVTKVYQIERTQEIYVILDASRLSARRLAPERKQSPQPEGPSGQDPEQSVLERFISAALIVGMAAQRQGDLFGVVSFSDKVLSFIRAGSGRAHYGSCRESLYALEPNGVSPDFQDMATFIRLRLRRRALLVVLTSLDDPIMAESFLKSIELVRRQHLILVNMIRPPGVKPFFSNPQVDSLDEIYGELGGHLQWHRLREVKNTLRHLGVAFSLVDSEAASVELVSQYINVKQRQLL